MKQQATVTKIVQEAPDVRTIFFTVAGGVMPFVAGQYISVYFDDLPLKAGKAYSLSSAPWDKQMSITVKNIGTFSGRLTDLAVGDIFQVSVPYGFFNVRNSAPIVALVAGVGISPVWSIIRDELNQSSERAVRLLYSAASWDKLLFKENVKALKMRAPHFAHHFFTTQKTRPESTYRRMEVTKDITDDERLNATFYICGSQDFVRSMWRQLMECGVDEQRIATEIFFESSI